MTLTLANVSTRLLTKRVNRRLRARHAESYISRVKHGKAGSPSLKDVVAQEAAAMLTEQAAALTASAAEDELEPESAAA